MDDTTRASLAQQMATAEREIQRAVARGELVEAERWKREAQRLEHVARGVLAGHVEVLRF